MKDRKYCVELKQRLRIDSVSDVDEKQTEMVWSCGEEE